NTKDGSVLGKTAARPTSAEFVAFLADIVAHQPKSKEIHVICDNLSAHKTARVKQFLADHPKVSLHYTPTYSSWLNQVELWFAKIERDVITRGIFTSVTDLKRKLMHYIRQYNKTPKQTNVSKVEPRAPTRPHQPPHDKASKLPSLACRSWKRESRLYLWSGSGDCANSTTGPRSNHPDPSRTSYRR